MAHDQDKFYEEEELDPREEGVEEESSALPNDVNDMTFFIELLRHLRTVIESGKSIPFTQKRIIDAGACLDILNDMDNNLPDAVQYGIQMYSERERILHESSEIAAARMSEVEMRTNAALQHAKDEAAQRILDAENDAQALLDDAQERADRMVEESEILRQAREEARILKNDARVEASEMRLKAQHDVYAILADAEEQLSEACKSIRRHRANLGGDEEE